MTQQNTSHILMIRPAAFGFNTQTASNNHYQRQVEGLDSTQAQELALKEFDAFAAKLKSEGIDVIIIEDGLEPRTPDSIFPNNWVSFHADGTVMLYPMFAENRRMERRMDILEALREKGFRIDRIMDLTDSEQEGRFLEGTGSMVLDRKDRIAYACLSLRTDETLLNEWAAQTGYEAVAFRATQEADGAMQPIYHTNVMMSVGEDMAVICADSIRDEKERNSVLSKLKETGKDIILITEEQKSNFVGNMLQVMNVDGDRLMVMSSQAFRNLTSSQIAAIERTDRTIHSPLDTIEALGGGSARCMMAEIFLPKELAEH